MKLTKYEHACVVLEQDGQKIVIDPGSFTQGLQDLSNVAALIITHEHMDHFDQAWIEKLQQENPDLLIFTTDSLALEIDAELAHAVNAGAEHHVGPFDLKFFGERHAEIHKTIPRPSNVGVLINNTVYYGGDSFDKPDVQPKLLLTPVSAPWLKMGEVIDYVDAVKPQICVPTHNALNSEIATTLTEVWLKGVCEKHNIEFKHLTPGDSIDC
ncbi:MAG TPA: MBL fold metallo-hydrolase [Candidatus Saccharimonadales bacterium]|nr:MBL fold metallo-hydrolase [Candidatus Saccharimonadales bacterium]